MMNTLLQTKLHIPQPRANLVPRPHLLARLDEGLRLGRRLTLLSAPAGFGKTTLLCHWVSAFRDAPVNPPCRAAWLSLDEGDNDPNRFLSYLIAALGVGGDVAALLAAQQPTVSIQEILSACINQAVRLDAQIVLVLDDYHLISSPGVHGALAYLLDHQPPTLHLALATRMDPPLPVARLRGRGQLTELRQADLGFSGDEVAAFLGQVMGLDLAPGDVAALALRTEGWATGLQMAGLAMQRRDPAELSAFLATLSGRHEHIADYFADEVLGGQPAGVQRFLLQTSILDRLCGPLCDAVCDPVYEPVCDTPCQGSGQQTLERLHASNLFVIPLDNERRWYRYHPLFADLLRQRLGRTDPERVPCLHLRASRWYEGNGALEPAIDHALHAGDWDRAADLIERAAEAISMRGELVTLRAWFAALPDAVVRRRPLLSLYYAALMLMEGQARPEMQPYLEIAAGGELAGSVADRSAVLTSLLAFWQGDAARSIELGRRALDQLSEQHLFWRGIVTGNLGIAYASAGRDLSAAADLLDRAAHLGERAGSVIGATIALCNRAEVCILQGDLHGANEVYERALSLARDQGAQRLAIGGMALIGQAGLLYEWNQVPEAERLLRAAVDLGTDALPAWFLSLDGYLALARVKQSQGDAAAALQAIERARAVAEQTGATEIDDLLVEAARARLWIVQGRLDDAARWAEGHGLGAADLDRSEAIYPLFEIERLALAELGLALGDTQRALDLLGDLLARSSALGRTDTVIKAQIRIALARQERGEAQESLAALSQALDLARAGGYLRTFLDLGPPMARLLRRALGEGIAPRYVGRLLAGFGPSAAPEAPGRERIEPLSDRELQVLRLLSTRLSNAEIGQELYVSINTVRYHTKNIYAKLGVHARADAVQRAKALHLI